MTGNEGEIAGTPLKILMTADAAGGVWQYCTDLVTELAQTGAEVLVATMGPRPSAEQKRPLEALPGVTIVESDFALEWMPDPWADVDAASAWLLDLQRTFQADVVHVNGYAHAGLAWAKPVVCVAHSCVYSWWRAVRGGAPDADWQEYRRRVTAGLSAANLMVAPSRFMASAIANEYGIARERMRVIYNFSRAQIACDHEKEPFILAAGRFWDPAKNLRVLEAAAPTVPWEIRVAGDAGPASGNWSEAVSLLGALPHRELMAVMSRAAIFAHPALYEPFGLSVLEAARARCCLVLADIPSLRELWETAAVFVDPRDPEAWSAALSALIRDDSKRESLASRAEDHARRYKPDPSVCEYRNVYQSLRAQKHGVSEGVAA